MNTIKEKALACLARKAYFKEELRQKLDGYGFKKEEIGETLLNLERSGWLQDEDLGRRFIEKQMRKGYGPKIIWHKLKEKAGEEIASRLMIGESQEALKKLIGKYRQKKNFQNKQKIISALLRRGYHLETILRNLD